MASSNEYLQFILDQLSELDEITYRAMMGEYIIYYRGKVVGGIYDDRLLVKPTKSAIHLCRMQFMSCPMMAQRKCCWWITWTAKSICRTCLLPCTMSYQPRNKKVKENKTKEVRHHG